MIGGDYRRRAGLILGASLGIIYALITQGSNLIILPGIPLYQPPFGPIGNGILIMLTGTLLGGIATWSHSSIEGVFASALAGSFMGQISFLITDKNGFSINVNKIISTLALFLPFAGMLAIVIGAFRWIANKLAEQHIDRDPWLRRAVLVVALFVLAGWLGLQWTYPPAAQTVLTCMNGLMQAAQSSTAALPEEFKSIGSERLARLAGIPYRLQYDKDDLNRFNIPRFGAGSWEEAAVIARMDNGAGVVCIFPTPANFPECKFFDDLANLN